MITIAKRLKLDEVLISIDPIKILRITIIDIEKVGVILIIKV